MALVLPRNAFAEPNGPPSALNPASSASAAIADLHNLVLVIAVAVFVVVEGLILTAAVRFRRRPKDDSEPAQVHGNTRLEIAWTIAPALIVGALFVLTLRAQREIDASAFSAQPGAPITVEVVGHQWWWEFQYPDLGVATGGQRIVTAGQLVIPVGRVINLKITSADVIHSFWVPELGGKTDAMKGIVNTTWLRADRPGDFYGQCAELCGVSHANMRFVVTAVSEDEFAAWARGQAQAAAEPTEAAAQAGRQVFLTAGCAGCHTINGVPQANGQTGPNLTHVTSRPYIAGGTLANTPFNLSRWLADPPTLKPGSLMPNLNLSTADIDSLVAYLQTLK
ncbi:MAG TPA: cytochrome c oxidase subunit II [Anaerolineae bacterium]